MNNITNKSKNCQTKPACSVTDIPPTLVPERSGNQAADFSSTMTDIPHTLVPEQTIFASTVTDMPQDVSNAHQTQSAPTENLTANEKGIFYTERILKKRTRNGRVEYLVKWLNYSHRFNTWEPRESFCHEEQIVIFELKLGKETVRQQQLIWDKLQRQRQRRNFPDNSPKSISVNSKNTLRKRKSKYNFPSPTSMEGGKQLFGNCSQLEDLVQVTAKPNCMEIDEHVSEKNLSPPTIEKIGGKLPNENSKPHIPFEVNSSSEIRMTIDGMVIIEYLSPQIKMETEQYLSKENSKPQNLEENEENSEISPMITEEPQLVDASKQETPMEIDKLSLGQSSNSSAPGKIDLHLLKENSNSQTAENVKPISISSETEFEEDEKEKNCGDAFCVLYPTGRIIQAEEMRQRILNFENMLVQRRKCDPLYIDKSLFEEDGELKSTFQRLYHFVGALNGDMLDDESGIDDELIFVNNWNFV